MPGLENLHKRKDVPLFGVAHAVPKQAQQHYSKTCVKRPLKNRQKQDLNDK